jgi:predicted transcriptional regulator
MSDIKNRKLYTRVGKNLTALLKKQGMLPAELARTARINKGKLHYVVHGQYCSLDVAVAVCKVLGITIDELVRGKSK